MDINDLQHADGFRDTVSTVTDSGKRKWMYVLEPFGKFYKLRNIVSYGYVLVFFLLPFIKVNGMPLLMLNFAEGKFIIFSKIFWPQDFFIFAVAMITFIVFIALFTVIYGRLFCGWVCPQTVFMEFIFRRIEWWIEGTSAQQKKLNEGPWTNEKLFKKTIKHTIFLVFSFLIANTFWAYIIGLDDLVKIIKEPIAEHTSLLTGLIVFTLLFYGVFAFVREIVCTTICPYGRLQSVLFDKDTMQISYDYNRGEPRGKFKKGEERVLGDCIGCNKCVQVCPTGIDIRDGVQMECVGCTACIDICNDIMLKVGLEPNLIRYASENEIAKKEKFHFNTRMKAYTGALAVLFVLMVYLIATRKSVDTYISRVSGQLYQEIEGNKLSNLYIAKIINKTRNEIPVTLKLEGIDGEVKLVSHKEVLLKKEDINETTFFVEIPKQNISKHSTKIAVGVYQGDEKIQTINTTFLGPFN